MRRQAAISHCRCRTPRSSREVRIRVPLFSVLSILVGDPPQKKRETGKRAPLADLAMCQTLVMPTRGFSFAVAFCDTKVWLIPMTTLSLQRSSLGILESNALSSPKDSRQATMVGMSNHGVSDPFCLPKGKWLDACHSGNWDPLSLSVSQISPAQTRDVRLQQHLDQPDCIAKQAPAPTTPP